MNTELKIGNRCIGKNHPCFIIAEMSGNHNMEYERAEKIVRAAKEAGADAIKLQTYTADTITLDSDKECFKTSESSLWKGTTLYKLYQQAYTPWEWQPELKQLADEIGIILFSSPFDLTSVDFLEKMDVPAYKIASFEITDIPLLKRVAKTGKPIIISTGIASLADIDLAINTCLDEGNDQIVLLKCTSQYPAPYKEMNINMIKNMQQTFGCVAGLSDHSMGDEIAIAATALGAKVIEKHFTLRREDGGVDSAFSMEIEEMRNMVQRIRNVEESIGTVSYLQTEKVKSEKKGARSLFACADIKKGEIFTQENIKSVRPGCGLHTKFYEGILGKKANRDLHYADALKMGDVDWDS